jgi:hypothetical protein
MGLKWFSALPQPQSQQAREICHSDWQISVEPLGSFLVGGIGYGADFEGADAVEQSRTRCATAFPGNARGTGDEDVVTSERALAIRDQTGSR